MNILSGRYKGLEIKTNKRLPYRPTSSKVRKSIFDILGNLHGLSVLDIFAGSGILGFEAASRGAEKLTFVDNNRKVIELIKANCYKLGNEVQSNVFCSKWDMFLKQKYQYDIIFADPPYGKIDIAQLTEKCFSSLLNNGRFILESSKRDDIPTGGIIKHYGDTIVTIWTKSV
ncbi:MAG: RsmD family RNA methyltransferase [Candidatus Neomarinimicrobiota bacterium]|nr:RsmD family RNA methyltransferase [Candidatus Neomarinimicrobiota bacterium]